MAIGAIAELAPNPFGGFAPFPNSIMIPFMGTQSAVLGYQFGLNYEAGKRMVKSMTNEDFNKLVRDKETFNISSDGKPQLLLDHLANTHWLEQMKNFQQNIPSALRLQDNIIEASVAIELKKANRTPSAMVEIVQAFANASGTELVENMDKIPDEERAFIITAVPMLGLIYTLFKFGKEQPFTNTGVKEPEPPVPFTPTIPTTSPTPTIEPDEPFIAPEIIPSPTTKTKISFKYIWHNKDGSTSTNSFSLEATEADHKTQILQYHKSINDTSIVFHIRQSLTDLLSKYRTIYHVVYGYWT